MRPALDRFALRFVPEPFRMTDRYYVDTPIAGPQARLAGSEAHHLAHVMRAKAGDEVLLFDGSGAEFTARIERVGRAEIELLVIERRQVDRELPVPIVLGVALPKGDRQRWLVEKCVELGVARIVPLLTVRGNARESAAGLTKLRRAVIEAAKQCGRNRLLEIGEPAGWAEFLASAPPGGARWIGHPGGQSLHAAGQTLGAAPPGAFWVAVGPEGGFTDDELAAAEAAGWTTVGLGRRILRIETAALALAAQCATLVER